MLDILALLFPFFGLILIGYAAARWLAHGTEGMVWLNSFILYAALPALFFKLVSRTPMAELARLDFILTDLAATYSIFLLVFLAGRSLRGNSWGESTIQAFGGAYGNIGYMGPGLALLALGDKAAVPVTLIICFENAAHFIVAPAMMALTGERKESLPALVARVLTRVALHPFILSCAAGFAMTASGWALPAPASRLVDMLAQSAAPCALFAMGVTLALRPLKRIPVEISYIVPAKLVLHPLVMWLAMTAMGIEPLWTAAAVLLAALPTAANVYVLGQQYDTWSERASATILIATLASVATVSLVLYALTSP